MVYSRYCRYVAYAVHMVVYTTLKDIPTTTYLYPTSTVLYPKIPCAGGVGMYVS